MARKTNLIPDPAHEARILDHCDRVDREAPLYASEDRKKTLADRIVTMSMPKCVTRGCPRRVGDSKPRCYRCTMAYRAYKAKQLAREMAHAC